MSRGSGNGGFPFFLILAVVFLILPGASVMMKHDQNPCPITTHQETQQSQPQPARTVKVDYDIQVGELYTGTPTPLTLNGEATFEENDSNSPTPNGLPATGWFPEHADISLTKDDGSKCVARIPVVTASVTSMLQCEGVENYLLFQAEVKKLENGHISVVGRFSKA